MVCIHGVVVLVTGGVVVAAGVVVVTGGFGGLCAVVDVTCTGRVVGECSLSDLPMSITGTVEGSGKVALTPSTAILGAGLGATGGGGLRSGMA